jgi:hypothetical protein
MTALQGLLAGMQITAAQIRGVAPLSAIKSAPQSSASAAIVNDTALFVSLPANSQWVFLSMVGYNGAGFTGSGLVGGLSDAWNVPANASCLWSMLGYGSGTSMVLNFQLNGAGAGSINHNTDNPSNDLPLFYVGQVTVGNIAGNLQYAWGQAALDAANPTVVVAGSFLAAWQVG